MRNASVECSHTGSRSTPASWENIANAHVLDELWVEVDGRVNGLKGGGEQVFWMGILKSTLTSLRSNEIVSALVSG